MLQYHYENLQLHYVNYVYTYSGKNHYNFRLTSQACQNFMALSMDSLGLNWATQGITGARRSLRLWH